jgi:hypothetical protein
MMLAVLLPGPIPARAIRRFRLRRGVQDGFATVGLLDLLDLVLAALVLVQLGLSGLAATPNCCRESPSTVPPGGPLVDRLCLLRLRKLALLQHRLGLFALLGSGVV